ncbi:hypothetical protein C8J57DRAFT_1599988 [Mycena rebaudengoi]|nr:hypothetical protein C8J57DRAFT_1599988 [Mycena rebaudengoi]
MQTPINTTRAELTIIAADARLCICPFIISHSRGPSPNSVAKASMGAGILRAFCSTIQLLFLNLFFSLVPPTTRILNVISSRSERLEMPFPLSTEDGATGGRQQQQRRAEEREREHRRNVTVSPRPTAQGRGSACIPRDRRRTLSWGVHGVLTVDA